MSGFLSHVADVFTPPPDDDDEEAFVISNQQPVMLSRLEVRDNSRSHCRDSRWETIAHHTVETRGERQQPVMLSRLRLETAARHAVETQVRDSSPLFCRNSMWQTAASYAVETQGERQQPITLSRLSIGGAYIYRGRLFTVDVPRLHTESG